MSEYIYETQGEQVIGIPKGFIPPKEEIVRCGYCRRYDWDGEPSKVYPDCHWCDKLMIYMPAGGFCSLGERDAG